MKMCSIRLLDLGLHYCLECDPGLNILFNDFFRKQKKVFLRLNFTKKFSHFIKVDHKRFKYD